MKSSPPTSTRAPRGRGARGSSTVQGDRAPVSSQERPPPARELVSGRDAMA